MAMRNYRAMGPEKLARCYSELAARKGDAFDRVVAKGEDPASHYIVARSAMQMKGLSLDGQSAPVHDLDGAEAFGDGVSTGDFIGGQAHSLPPSQEPIAEGEDDFGLRSLDREQREGRGQDAVNAASTTDLPNVERPVVGRKDRSLGSATDGASEDKGQAIQGCRVDLADDDSRVQAEATRLSDTATSIGDAVDPDVGFSVDEAGSPGRKFVHTHDDTKPVRWIAPMLAYDAHGDLGRVPREGWVMEPKWDGWRWQVHIREEGVISFGGRNGKRHDGAAPAVDAWLVENVPVGTVLDGEILWEDGKSSRQQAQFVAFDILRHEDRDVMLLPWFERRELLEELLRDPRAVATDQDGPVRVSPYTDVSEVVLSTWLDLGLEGCVAKRMNASYQPGTRRQDGFLKVKPAKTTDAIVTGFEMGKGADNKHRCGALTIRLIDTDVDTSTGYDATPEEAQELIGRRIEIAHYGWFESGNVRHPIYKRLRPDLEAA